MMKIPINLLHDVTEKIDSSLILCKKEKHIKQIQKGVLKSKNETSINNKCSLPSHGHIFGAGLGLHHKI